MKKKTIKKEKKQIVEIHIYIHHDHNYQPINPVYPGTAPYNLSNPPYTATC